VYTICKAQTLIGVFSYRARTLGVPLTFGSGRGWTPNWLGWSEVWKGSSKFLSTQSKSLAKVVQTLDWVEKDLDKVRVGLFKPLELF
jgi:hypothetical protein